MARVLAGAESPATGRAAVHALGRAYWGMGLGIGIVLLLFAPWVATHWLHAGQGDAAALSRTVRLMALALLLYWPVTFYEAGLLGLQRLVAQGALRVFFGTAAGAGAALVLWLVAATPDAFFAWQALIAGIQVAVTAVVFDRLLPGRGTARGATPPRLWRFTAGVGAATATTALLGQFATLLLARLLPPERFGAYALATTAANGLLVLVAPVLNVAYPRLAELVARGEAVQVRLAFRGALRTAALLVVPAGVTLALTAEDVLRVWTRDAAIASMAAPALRALAVGFACTALGQLPFALELAHRRSRALTALTLGALAAGTIALAIGTPMFGLGAVWGLAAVLLVYLIACLLLLPRHAFPEGSHVLVRQDLLPILFAAVAAGGAVRLAAGAGPHHFLVVLLTGAASMAASLLASWSTRSRFGAAIARARALLASA
jgi:O-antigen/teichoic acid export membrane protein